VIYTSDGNAYLHLPGVIVAKESATVGLTVTDNTLFVSFGNGKLYAFGK
jgi:hypothetical protein